MSFLRGQYFSVLLLCTGIWLNLPFDDAAVFVQDSATGVNSEPVLLNLRQTESRIRRDVEDLAVIRSKRAASDQGKLIVNIVKLKDRGHSEAIVHWSGEESRAIFLLTRARDETGNITSSVVYRSTDYGASFSPVKIGDAKTLIYMFYVCPNNKEKLIFVDSRNRMLYVTSNEGDKFDQRPVVLPSSPDRLLFHPVKDDWLLMYSDLDRKLYFSEDLAKTWDLIDSMVNPRFYWGIPGIDHDDSTVHMEAEDPATGRFIYKAVKRPYPSAAEPCIEHSLGNIVIGSLVVQKEYIFVQKLTDMTQPGPLFVSHNRQSFKRAYFPRQVQHTDFVILDAADKQVFIAANHKAGAVTLYLSDVSGQFYIKSIDQVVSLNQGSVFQVDLHEVKGMQGTYLVNQYSEKKPRTLITFDQGGMWHPVPAPDKYENESLTNCKLPACSLYIHQLMDAYLYGIPPPLSDKNAPGLVLAQGVIGNESVTRFVMSRDGGLTWKVVFTGTFRKAILDQGGAIVAVEFSTSSRIVREILYSCTEGEKPWQTYPFTEEKMVMDGLLNEPGINTLVSSLYGHTANVDDVDAGWIIAKLNFSQILSKRCEAKDYDFWVPASGNKSSDCILGERMTFERRHADAECYNGEDYERAVNVTSCLCTQEDFECDFGYEESGSGGECVVADWFDPSVPIEDCEVGQQYMKSRGYRKVAADNCTDMDESGKKKHESESVSCPPIRPEGLAVEVIGRSVLRTRTNITFQLTLDRGNQSLTRYSWNFGDGTMLNIKGLGSGHVVHLYNNKGFYEVFVNATSDKGSDLARIKIWVQDTLAGLYVSRSRVARVNRPLMLRAVPIFHDLSYLTHTDIHFLWVFGDEIGGSGNTVGTLSWNSSIQHTYTRPGNFSVWVEAFNGAGSAFQNFILPVYGTATTVQLTLKGLRMPYGEAATALQDLVEETLKKVLAYELSVDTSRLDVEFGEQFVPLVYVSILPRQQLATVDDNIQQIVNMLLLRAQDKDIQFTLPDEAFGAVNNITVTSAVVVPDDDSQGKYSSLLGYVVGVSVIVIVTVSCIGVVVHYRRKLRNLNHYRILRSRYRNGSGDGGPDSLAEETDDDEPLIDPSVTSGVGGQSRLALSDDEELQSAHVVMTTNRRGVTSSTLPVDC